jgi:antimicrobial peptide system SdpA family protein
MDDDGGRRLRRLRVLVITGWVLLGAYSLAVSLPSFTIEVPGRRAIREDRLLLQGWGMFTKSPRSSSYQVFVHRASDERSMSWLEDNRQSRASFQTAFGFDRSDRSVGVELANLANDLPLHAWHSCHATLSRCLDKTWAAQPSAALRNGGPRPTICGVVILANVRPVSWVYWREGEVPGDATTRATLAKVDVRC